MASVTSCASGASTVHTGGLGGSGGGGGLGDGGGGLGDGGGGLGGGGGGGGGLGGGELGGGAADIGRQYLAASVDDTCHSSLEPSARFHTSSSATAKSLYSPPYPPALMPMVPPPCHGVVLPPPLELYSCPLIMTDTYEAFVMELHMKTQLALVGTLTAGPGPTTQPL
jgi:hypothetical protein